MYHFIQSASRAQELVKDLLAGKAGAALDHTPRKVKHNMPKQPTQDISMAEAYQRVDACELVDPLEKQGLSIQEFEAMVPRWHSVERLQGFRW